MNILLEIADNLKTQDNRITENPMFCVQIKRRDVGYDSGWIDDYCWINFETDETIFSDDKDLTQDKIEMLDESKEWDKFGYVDQWETVMVAFTEKGCKKYLELNGHNVRPLAHNGEVRIYVESFNCCPEMISIRDWLLKYQPQPEHPLIPLDHEHQAMKSPL